MDDDDSMTGFIFPFADRFILVSSSIVVIEAHATPIIGVQAQCVQHWRHNGVISVDHSLQRLVVGQENITVYKLQKSRGDVNV